MLDFSRRVHLLHRATGVIGAGATVENPKTRVVGHQRVKGNFHADQPPAVGFPRVRQSHDGATWNRIDVVPRDLSQPDFQFAFDFSIRADYVSVEWTQGAAPTTFFFCQAFVLPHYGVGDDSFGSVSGSLQLLRSDKDTHFTTGILANNHEAENLTGLLSNLGVIESVTLLAEDNIDWEIHFWSSDGFDAADLDADSWLEYVALPASSGVPITGATPTTFRYAATGLNVPYFDGDGTNELHVSLVPRGANKTAGAGGEVVLVVGFRAE